MIPGMKPLLIATFGVALIAIPTHVLASEAEPNEKRAVRRFASVIRGKPTRDHLAAKRLALVALREFDSAAVAGALINGYARLEREAEPLRTARCKVLFDGGGNSRLSKSRDTLQPIRDLQGDIISALDRLRSPDSIKLMLGRVIQSSKKLPLTLKLVLAARAGDLSGDDIELVIGSAGRLSGTEGTLVMLRALAPLGRRAAEASTWALTQLAHKQSAVRSQAIRTLSQLASGGAIVPLIARIEAETGSLREEVLDALVVLTGAHAGNSAESWNEWLKTEGGPYVRGEKKLGRGDASKRKRKEDNKTTTGSYFGLPQTGRSILYVFDVSKSMHRTMSGKRPKGSSVDGDEEIRWERCQVELIAAIDKLTPNKTFNMIGFANELKIFDQKQQRATPKNKRRAKEWIERLHLKLQTNIHDALELTFYMAGRGAKDRYYEPEVDTVFFLSDGAPTRASGGKSNRAAKTSLKRDEPERILSAVKRWNALGRITVHTIGIGLKTPPEPKKAPRKRERPEKEEAGPAGFMSQLAQQNFGQFVTPRPAK